MIDLRANAGGIKIGDYVQTERTEQLIVADGRDIFGFGYTNLENVVPISTALANADYLTNGGTYNALYVTNNGVVGYRGIDGATIIERIDFTTGETVVQSGTFLSTLGYYHACGTNDGSIVYFVGVSGAGDTYCTRTLNNGASWDSILVTNQAATQPPVPTTDDQRCLIECDDSGETVRIIFTASTSVDETVVFESTDSGGTWNEILTPRQTLTDPGQNSQSAISKNLTTLAVTDLTRLYTSVGGSTFSDKASNYTGTLGTNTRLAISDDGTVIVGFESDEELENVVNINVTRDGGDNWEKIPFNLRLTQFDPVNVKLATLRFEPDNPNIVYAIISPAFAAGNFQTPMAYVYKLNIFEFTVERMGQLQPTDANVIQSTLAHKGSYVTKNNTGFTFSFFEAATTARDFSLSFTEGKLILNTTTLPDPLKLFAGPQVEGFAFNWERLNSPTTTDLLCTYVSSDKSIIVGGGFQTIARSIDSGTTFTLPVNGFTNNCNSIDGADDASVIIGSGVGEARYSTDNGATWNASTGLSRSGTSADDVSQVCSCIADGSTVIVGFIGGELDVSTNGGVIFNLLATPFSGDSDTSVRSGCIAKGNDQIIYVGNSDATIRRSTNGGTSFTLPTTPPVINYTGGGDNIVFEIACSSDGSKVIATIGDQAFISNDSGDTWSEIAVKYSKSFFRGLTISDDGNVILMTNGDGLLVRSTDGGINFYKTDVQWQQRRRNARGIELSPDGTIAYALIDDGLIYRTAP